MVTQNKPDFETLNIPEHVKRAFKALPVDIQENLIAFWDDENEGFIGLGLIINGQMTQLANPEYAVLIHVLEEQYRKECNTNTWRGKMWSPAGGFEYKPFARSHGDTVYVDEMSRIQEKLRKIYEEQIINSFKIDSDDFEW